MTSPNPPQVSKTSLWVAIGVLLVGAVLIALVSVLTISASVSPSLPSPAPSVPADDDDYLGEDPEDPVISGKLPTDNFTFESGKAVTEDMTVSSLVSMKGEGSLDTSRWSFDTPPDGFLSSYTNGTCTILVGTYTVNPEESAFGDEEATYLALDRIIGLSDRSLVQASDWGWAPESILGDSTASFLEARWGSDDGNVHSAAVRSVGTSGTGMMFYTSCSGDEALLDETVRELRTAFALSVFSFKM